MKIKLCSFEDVYEYIYEFKYTKKFREFFEFCEDKQLKYEFNFENLGEVTKASEISGIVHYFSLVDVSFNIFYKKYKIIDFYKSDNKYVFKVENVSNKNVEEVGIDFFADLGKEKTILVQILKYFDEFSRKYNEKIEKKLWIEDQKLFYSCLTCALEKGYFKTCNKLDCDLESLKKFANSCYLSGDSIDEKEFKKESVPVALFMYLNKNTQQINEKTKKYTEYFEDFKEFVRNKSIRNSRFFQKIDKILNQKYFRLNNDLKVLAAGADIFFREVISHENTINSLGKDFKTSLTKSFLLSKFIGELGKRGNFENHTIFEIKQVKFNNKFERFNVRFNNKNNFSRSSLLIKTFDKNYNIVSFFIDSDKVKNLDIDIGKKISFTGIVKSHRIFDGKKETTVNRVNIVN